MADHHHDQSAPPPSDPIAIAQAIRYGRDQDGYSWKQIARLLAMSEANVSRYLKLLDFPLEIQALIQTRQIPFPNACLLRQQPATEWSALIVPAQGDYPRFADLLRQQYGDYQI